MSHNLRDGSSKVDGKRNTTSAGKEVVVEGEGTMFSSESTRSRVHSPSPPLQPPSSSSSSTLPLNFPPFLPLSPPFSSSSPSSSSSSSLFSSSSSSSFFSHSNNPHSSKKTNEDPVPLFHRLSDLILSRYPSSIKSAVALCNLYIVINQVI